MLKNKETEQCRELAALQQDLEHRMKIVDDVSAVYFIFILSQAVLPEHVYVFLGSIPESKCYLLACFFIWIFSVSIGNRFASWNFDITNEIWT